LGDLAVSRFTRQYKTNSTGSVLGFCCLDPDGGDYGNWVPQAQSVLANWAPTFASAGARPSLQRAQGGYWVQIDVDPAFSGKPV
jgi:hypothetical protein